MNNSININYATSARRNNLGFKGFQKIVVRAAMDPANITAATASVTSAIVLSQFRKQDNTNSDVPLINAKKPNNVPKKLDENLNGWIIIPSQEHDPWKFEANVDKLKMLLHDNRCTRSSDAKPYLAKGDFHVYMEKGRPKLGIRFVGDKIQEIESENNRLRIPLTYGDITKEHIKNYELSYFAKDELYALEKTKEKIKEIQQNKFPKGINNYPAEEIFEKFGIKCKKDEDGFITISHYKAMIDDVSFSDIGIDENWLMKNVKRIEGDAKFENSQITSFCNLESIGGKADFRDSTIKSLGNLKSIDGDADFYTSQITSLGDLESIGGNACFTESQIISLGKLKSIGGHASFYRSKVASLGDLVLIGKNANFESSEIEDLGNLQSIGEDAYFTHSRVTNLGKLESIGGHVNFYQSQVTNLGNLRTIGGNVNFVESQVTKLGKLRTIGKNAYFEDSKITSLGNLESIGEDVYIRNSKLKPEDFASVEIGGDIY